MGPATAPARESECTSLFISLTTQRYSPRLHPCSLLITTHFALSLLYQPRILHFRCERIVSRLRCGVFRYLCSPPPPPHSAPFLLWSLTLSPQRDKEVTAAYFKLLTRAVEIDVGGAARRLIIASLVSLYSFGTPLYTRTWRTIFTDDQRSWCAWNYI